MHSKSDSIEFMNYDNPHEVIELFFESLFNRHQIGLETSMICSDVIFDYVHLLYYKWHKKIQIEVDHI